MPLLEQKQIEGLGGGALTPANHKALDQLVHNVAEDSVEEPLSTNGIITSHTWYTDGTKTVKIRDVVNTNVNGIATQEVHKQYDNLGASITGEILTKVLTVTNGVISLSTNTVT